MKNNTSTSVQEHQHHSERHLLSTEKLQDIVIGMSDGLTVPFALAAGLSGAIHNNAIIVTAGIAEIIAGSIAMGLGGYLAGATAINHYQNELKRELQEIEHFPEIEKEEVRESLREYNLSATTIENVVEELSANKTAWAKFMMRNELGLEQPAHNRAMQSAIYIGGSYIIGGLIPLLPYMLIEGRNALLFSCGITLLCLFVFGYFKSKLTGMSAWSGALRVMLIGAIAASAAFGIAKLFSA